MHSLTIVSTGRSQNKSCKLHIQFIRLGQNGAPPCRAESRSCSAASIAEHGKGGMQRNFTADFGWRDDFPHARRSGVTAVSGQSCSLVPHPKAGMGKD